ncbi:cell envelope integrity protein TolA [Rhizobium binae]|uniref:cell envelope integrity protein TolA n=1 Tax=Rhizobium binae TaxID=1138190 RepID=UPI001C837031|nr:energy transducer TonB [Rhizobium binae]MBX4948963.1 energy transducer TonB [Rhizobium binae]MBX4969923.1 energy transducer TonB [Rhizobium binae]
MAISAKTRSRQVLIGKADAGGSLNDNTPGMHPGHELSELRNAPRQPAGETVIHYTRFAQISAFPDHPETVPASPLSAPPMDAAVQKQEGEKKPMRRRETLSCFCSLIFHVTLAAVVIVAFPHIPEEAIEEAGEAVSVVMYGNSDVDQTAAGETDVTVQEEIIPEAVEPETIQPTEVSPAEAQDPIQQAPSQEVTRVSPEITAAVEPEILVSEVQAETAIAQPMSMVIPEERMPSDEIPPEIQPFETPPVAAVEPEEVVPPKPKSKAVTEEKPKPVEKRRPPNKTAGSKGEAQQDSTRGVAEGNPSAQSDRNSQAASNNNGVGTAARANYGGKVRARIRRALREPKNVSGTAAVTLTIAGSGNLVSAVISRSSGVSEIDQAAADAVRRASPFSPPPGGSSMRFTQVFEIGSK